jgi:hypothetical protein
MKRGRRPSTRRLGYCARFSLKARIRIDHLLNEKLLDQLDRCKTDEARKVLLGIRK